VEFNTVKFVMGTLPPWHTPSARELCEGGYRIIVGWISAYSLWTLHSFLFIRKSGLRSWARL